jgi:hypothetical protein
MVRTVPRRNTTGRPGSGGPPPASAGLIVSSSDVVASGPDSRPHSGQEPGGATFLPFVTACQEVTAGFKTGLSSIDRMA